MLLEALQVYEDEISSSSGLPIWVTRSDEPDIRVAVEERIDQADAALEEYDENHRGDKRKRGATRMAVVVDSTGKPIEYDGTTRHRFMVSAIQETRASSETEASEEGLEDDLAGLNIGASPYSREFDPSEYGDG